MSEEILTRNELAKKLKCSTRHLDMQINQGLPSLLLGRTRRFILSEVLDYLKNQSKKTIV